MKNYIVLLAGMAVFAVVGNFFSFWAIPGLEGMTTFQQKRALRIAEDAPPEEQTEEDTKTSAMRESRKAPPEPGQPIN